MNLAAIYVLPQLGITDATTAYINQNLHKVYMGDISRENKHLIRVAIKNTRDQDSGDFYKLCCSNPYIVQACVTKRDGIDCYVYTFKLPDSYSIDLEYIRNGSMKYLSVKSKLNIINFWDKCTEKMYEHLFLNKPEEDIVETYRPQGLEIYSYDNKRAPRN